MKSSEVRKKFLEFFRERGHSIEKPASLIPKNDPSLLFTGAGMNQFKELFFGKGTSSLKRAATCQRCLRATDIENVGKTIKHLTFIEMLGNFSFGDYFKKEAICMAWEFTLKHLKIPEEKLLVTVHRKDDEALKIWEETGLKRDKIFLMDDRDNFWDMGKTGPCGPCSEIIVDRGKSYGCARSSCGPACDCERHIELWNLVFTQFDRKEDGKLEPLEQKNIDTGMGLERAALVAQDVQSLFDTDLIKPIVLEAGCGEGTENAEEVTKSCRVIADHLRAITFCVADGVLPSNESRGYVLRKLIRRAVQHGRKLGEKKPFLYKLVPTVLSLMEDFYSELRGRGNDIGIVVKAEEERFFTVFEKLPELEGEIAELSSKGEKELPGELYFKYYDTYGIPKETIIEIAESKGLGLDEEGFMKALTVQKERSRSASSFTGPVTEIPDTGEKTEFTGYDEKESSGKILRIYKNGSEVSQAKEGDEVAIITDRTPFYAEAGGQSGDKGEIVSKSSKFVVKDTKKLGQQTVHGGIVIKGSFKKKDPVKLAIDSKRRMQIARNHTATHLLQNSLRRILGSHIRQCGSYVGPDRLRFDFTHSSAISETELSRIEESVNCLIRENSAVTVLELPLNEALKTGAIALFDEKYADVVRVVKMGEYSMELCGGTHLNSTGEIGIFLIENESSIAAGARRIEAISGEKAYSEIKRIKNLTTEISRILKERIENSPERIKKLQEELRSVKKKLENLHLKKVSSGIEDILPHAKTIDGVRVISHIQDGLSQAGLRQLADKLKEKLGSGIVVLGSCSDGKVYLVAGVTPDLIEKGWHAGELVKKVAQLAGGSGGGRADFAQAGAKEAERLKEAISSVPEIIKKHGELAGKKKR